jgi:glyceraldehyde-3-phosphate dehydrogenase type II
MTEHNVVHIIGTGTIGEPLIGLFLDKRKELGIDEVTFHKRTPLYTDRSKVVNLIRRGANLATDADRKGAFAEMGMEATYEAEEAIRRASVVIDCTPKGVGHKNKAQYYEKHSEHVMGFIAQGSETGFGVPYARGINDSVMDAAEQFVQVVSCNTHNLANGRKKGKNLARGNFVCIRRANDISQDDSYLPSPQAGEHKNARYGTHHAEDVHRLYGTIGEDLDVFSTALKVPTQYMHTVVFNFRLKDPTDRDTILANMAENPYVALSHKMTANSVFSFGRDHGYYGRILNQAVLPTRSLHVSADGKEVWGHCFTPQDGNSLLSSVAATLRFLDAESVEEKLRVFEPYLFKEV